MLYTGDYELLLITESWAHCDISSGLLDPESKYNILRKDRDGRGGGVCVLIRRSINIVQVELAACYNSLELICFDVICGASALRLRFFLVYRPPYSNTDAVKYLDLLLKCIERYSRGSAVNVITGDFNCPDIDWRMLNCPDDNINKQLLDFTVACGLCQCVNFPTRDKNILDLILTDDDQLINTVASDPPLGLSDHLVVKFSMVLNFNVVSCPVENKLNWSKANYEAMELYLSSVDWQSLLLCNPNALSFWCEFESVVNTAIALYVPAYKERPTAQRITKRKYPRNILKLRAKKRRVWRKLQTDPDNPAIRAQYKEIANEWGWQVRNCEKQSEMRIIESDNLGSFYRYVNKRISYRTDIAALTNNAGGVIVDNVQKADMFNEYFASVGTIDNNITPVCNSVVGADKLLETVEFNAGNVLAAMNKLKSNLSSGPDGFPPVMFKRLKYCFAAPLAMLFTQLLSVAAVPEAWKCAVITPVFKKGAAGKVSNYRPISLTCVCSKLMERVIAQCMYRYLSENRILHHAQHGFVKGRSTCTNLLESINDWTVSLQFKRGVTVAYIDFSKAFDTVCHEKLFSRLKSYGIYGNLLQWLKNLFSGRTHRTRVGVSLSAIAKLLSGVIQGSGIGPLMFLTFINELIELMERYGVIIKLFADDAKLYAEIVSITDVYSLQLALDELADWAARWQLTIAIDKCCILNIGKIPPSIAGSANYNINNNVLPVVSSCRDLGIIVSSDLSPRLHINAVVLKAQQRANLILRCFISRDLIVLQRAFIVYVRPLLEFNTVVWSPSLKCDIDNIERVQRRFTKRLPGLRYFSYSERLWRLDLTSLELRRLHTDLIMCYKIVFGIIDLNFGEFFTVSPSTVTRGHQYKLYRQRGDATARNNFFSIRVVNIWNNLPVDIVDFTSITTFVKTVKLVNFCRYLKGSM